MKSGISSYRVFFYFLVASILIVMVLPHEGQLKYELHKGKPWMYESLVAPFDFPIYKTDDELQRDRNEVDSSYKPFFRVDHSVAQEELKRLSDMLDLHRDKVSRHIARLLIGKLSGSYKQGIWRTSDLKPPFSERSLLTIAVVDGNVSEDRLASKILTVEDAYIRFASALSDSISAARFRLLNDELNLQSFFKPNLVYDEATTEKVKSGELANIPITKGVVSAGTLIVSKNEIVSPDTYQLLKSLQREYEDNVGYSGNRWIMIGGQFILVALCLSTLVLLLSLFYPDMLRRSSNLIFIVTLIVVAVYFSILAISSGKSIYIVPLSIVPIYISTFFNPRPALYIYWTILLLVGFYAPNSFEFVTLSFIAGIASIISFRTMYRRGKLFIAIGSILFAYVLSYIAIQLIQERAFSGIRWSFILNFLINVLLVLTAYQLVYVFEKAFGFLSNVTLMELSDTNRKLLRKLAESAPGTFQHSIQVANLAEAAIREIGGNPLLVRCGALYHDIGKIENAGYFIENQTAGFTLHDRLEPEESAKIIIRHVEDGVALAKKHKLPALIVDFIRTHHATSYTRYFLSKYVEKHPAAKDFSTFKYPGPNPTTKEMAVLMMADGIEAASRTLSHITPETINALVNRIIDAELQLGYLNNVNITFRDVEKVKVIFKSKLATIYHSRIAYPDDKPADAKYATETS